MDTTYVHDLADLDPAAVDLLGGKGAGLGRMHRLGLPVPAAFVIDTNACRSYREAKNIPDGLVDQARDALARLETQTGKTFCGDGGRPLLVSVRSGAKVSMPGMMDTVLNLGLDRHSVLRLAQTMNDAAFAVDTWVRFWAMFADIVLDVDAEWLKQSVATQRQAAIDNLDEHTAGALEDAILAALDDEGVSAPTDPHEQVVAAMRAVFSSWDSRRAKAYRAHHGIPDDLGTAVVVQAMVFGNAGGLSGSGVAFTRDPKTGENVLFGEFLAGGQGEEVVAGTATPVNLTSPQPEWVATIAALEAHGRDLEREYRDALDIEFTVEEGTLYLLQVRAAKRTAAAAVRTAIDLVDEGLIDTATALRRVSAEQVRTLVAPAFVEAELAAAELLFSGIGASPGHAGGFAVLDGDRAALRVAAGEDVILLRPTTSPQDLPGMLAAQAVVTAKGGATSHAAVVSRALDKPCVTGCERLEVRPDEGVFLIDGTSHPEGTYLSVDGATGNVYAGHIGRGVPEGNLTGMAALLRWADDASAATVWTTDGAHAGPIALTDVLLGAGSLDVLLAALDTLSTDQTAKVPALADAIATAVEPLLAALPDRPVDLRLPVLISARARRTVGEWASLAPELLAPLGAPRLLDAYVDGIAAAAERVGHKQVTVHLGGVTNPAEVARFVERVGESSLAAGAVLSNAAILARPALLVETGAALWIDLPELIRTACGRPAELLFSVDEDLPPLVEDLLVFLAAATAGTRIGVDLSGGSVAHLAPALHRWGYRHFAAGPGQAEALRLVLGQTAVPDAGFAH
ncbi:MAG: pyruvate, phosphate dikinase [Sporichthyaceae bacterium]